MRVVCSAGVVGLSLGLSLLVNPAMAGFGEMDIAFGYNLLPRAKSTAKESNLQTFTGALGGATADPITSSTTDPTHPFAVDGDTFPDFPSALNRSCANQHNACADIANGSNSNGLTTGQCDTQQNSCLEAKEGTGTAAASSTTTTSAQPTLFSQDAEFVILCDA